MRRRAVVIALVLAAAVPAALALGQEGEPQYSVFLPVARLDPTATPVPTATAAPDWWDEACRGKQVRELVADGGFERGAGGPWISLWPEDYYTREAFRFSTINAQYQSAHVHSGGTAIVFPPRRNGRAEVVLGNHNPFRRYAAPETAGPRIGAARLRYWWMYQTSQPATYADDYIEAVLMNCRQSDDRAKFSGYVNYLEYFKVNLRDANKWRMHEEDATRWMQYGDVARHVPDGRWCLALRASSADDGEPAAFYFDDVSLQVCEAD